MIQLIKNTLSIHKQNWPTLLYFEIIHRTVSSFLIYTFYQEIMSLILKNTGLSILTQENIRLMLIHPLSILLLISLFLLIAALLFFEITALLIYGQYGWQQQSLSLLELYRQSVKTSQKYLRLKNMPLLILLALLIILSSFPFTASFLRFSVPEFIKDAMLADVKLALLYWLLLIAVNTIVFTFLFGFIFIQQSPNFSEAWKKSMKLIAKQPFRLFGNLIIFMLLLQLGLMLIALIIILLLAANTILAGEGADAFRFGLTKFSDFFRLANDIITTSAMISFIVIESHGLNDEPRQPTAKKQLSLTKRLGRTLIGAFAIALLLIFSEGEIGGALYTNNQKDTQIIAHRAGAAFAPENTLAALEAAISAGADSAEIDVQQTQDGTLIIMHDTNFKRTTGYDSQVWDNTYDIVQTLDAGSFFAPEFANEPIPTLEMMLAAAKNRIHLMIELKSSGHERQLVETTIALIQKYGMEDQCSIASMDSAILQQTKAINPSIETVLITAVFYAPLLDYDTIDGYSIETTFVNYEIASLTDFSRKKLYVWTANEDANINKVLRLGVDGIVTDNPLLASYYKDMLMRNLWMDSLTEFFFPAETVNQ
ncbi:glycerophosphodiester phosphodiesterase family protein [Dielma fastidiosa]|uniref:Glycerophosphoryl diester phosphodiesterase membrane domain-containing protein n=3 Tax=Dielma fastidiosa TaxID=1034346 RepID=A0AB35UN39_9FIRM|nr:glycerophosphodiester phosphodiesterase family protein [Dielma fastidiosa]MDY5168833.1 glycerophosphoryl diester phosphodiesterase membrane domain-containing protein [Dielma fastidiosa]